MAVHERLEVITNQAVVELVRVIVLGRIDTKVSQLRTAICLVGIGSCVDTTTLADACFEQCLKADHFSEQMQDERDV